MAVGKRGWCAHDGTVRMMGGHAHHGGGTAMGAYAVDGTVGGTGVYAPRWDCDEGANRPSLRRLLFPCALSDIARIPARRGSRPERGPGAPSTRCQTPFRYPPDRGDEARGKRVLGESEEDAALAHACGARGRGVARRCSVARKGARRGREETRQVCRRCFGSREFLMLASTPHLNPRSAGV